MQPRHFFYNPNDTEGHKKLGKALKGLPAGEYVVKVELNRPVRSLDQNKYYHAILKIIGAETGNEHDELHRICKQKFNSDTHYREDGTAMVYVNSTSDLNSKEFTAYINNVKQWALEEFQIVIPDRKDLDVMKWMQIEDNYDATFSGM